MHWKSVPWDFNYFHLVLLLLPLIPGQVQPTWISLRAREMMMVSLCNDDKVSVGALVDLFDGVVENPFHVDLPQRLDDWTILRIITIRKTQQNMAIECSQLVNGTILWWKVSSSPAYQGVLEDPIVWQFQPRSHSLPLCRSCRGHWNKKRGLTFLMVRALNKLCKKLCFLVLVLYDPSV